MRSEKRSVTSRLTGVVLSAWFFFIGSGLGYGVKTIDVNTVRDKMKGCFAGQMIGVGYGEWGEFSWQCTMRPLDTMPFFWDPNFINKGFYQDDTCPDTLFIKKLYDDGLIFNWHWAGDIWRYGGGGAHANGAAHSLLNSGYDPPLSGHYLYNSHAECIDWQIDGDSLGMVCPGMPMPAMDITWRLGHVINYGNGVYGAMYVSAMIQEAYFASSLQQIIEAGRQVLPEGSVYRRQVDDVINWHSQGHSIESNWQLHRDKYWHLRHCSDFSNPSHPWYPCANIEAGFNGAYILMGLLYGNGDFQLSMEKAGVCGQDSDCNMASAGGIIGCWIGWDNIPGQWTQNLNYSSTFNNSGYTFNQLIDNSITLARRIVLQQGGSVSGSGGSEVWTIPDQEIIPPILEEWPFSPNDIPTLNATINSNDHRHVTMSATASDADGIKNYVWHFGDLTYAHGRQVGHTYRDEGQYEIICYVTDNIGNTQYQTLTVDVYGPADEDVPHNVTATAASTSWIDLTWTNQPGSAATAYQIERKTGEGSFGLLTSVSNTTSSYSDTGLPSGTTCTYRLRADLGGGSTSIYSNEATATTLLSPPTAPTGLTAVAASDSLRIDLNWTDNADNEEGFAIERRTDGDFVEIATQPADATSHIDTSGLAPETTYTYRVRAYNSGKAQFSNYSNEASDTTTCIQDPITVDDADPVLTYTGSWNPRTGLTDRYLETTYESDSAGATISIDFSGEIRLYAEKQSWGGTASIYIDDAPHATLADFYDDTGQLYQQEIFAITGLPSGSHTLRMEVDGTGWCYVDYFVYTPVCEGADNPPAAPDGLTAVAQGPDTITLNWTDNSGDNADAEDEFRIERMAEDESDYTTIGTLSGEPGTGNTMQYNDADLDYATTYCYRVLASNSIGDSDNTPAQCVTTYDPDPPAGPTGLVALAGDKRVTLAWDTNTETDPAVLYYTIRRSTSEAGPYLPVAVAFGADHIIDFSVHNDTTYYYRLRAVDTWPHISSDSAMVSATPHVMQAPAAPGNLVATAVAFDEIALTWSDNADNETGFRIERKTVGDFAAIATAGENIEAYNDTGLNGDTTYTYRIIAYNNDGDSPAGDQATAATPPTPVPAAPSNVSAAAHTALNQIIITWQDNSDNEDGFRIERRLSFYPFEQIAVVSEGMTEYTDISLDWDTEYDYRIAAYNSYGNSTYSDEASATTPPAGGDIITGLVAHWQLDESSGSTASDATGQNHNGTLTNGPAWDSSGGRIGGAISFDGVDDYVTIPHSSDLAFTASQSFTLSAWVHIPTLPGKWTGIITKSRDTAPTHYGLWINPDNQWHFGGGPGVNGGTVTTGWHHLVLVQDAGAATRTIYADGSPVATGNAEDGSGTGDLWLGGAKSVSEYFSGQLDDVRIYSRALTQDDIQALP